MGIYLYKIKQIVLKFKTQLIVLTSIILLLFLFILILNSIMNRTFLMAHALGAVKVNGKEYVYTNTIDAYNNSLKKGFKHYEVDLMLTSDNEVIAFHGYSKGIYGKLGIKVNNFTYDEFMSGVVFKGSKIENLKPTDLDDIINLIKTNKSSTWVFHLHTNNDATNTDIMLNKITDKLKNDTDSFCRIYIGINYKEELPILNKYNIKNKIYHLYEKEKRDEEVNTNEKLINYIKKNGIVRISMEKTMIPREKDLIKLLKNNNIEIMTYTENKLLNKLFLKLQGTDLVETDSLGIIK